jgi:sodium/bile acid cotransporter 7
MHVAVAIAFLISGLTLPLANLHAAAGRVRLHVFIQGFCFVLVPALVWCARPLLAALGASPELVQGFLVLACLPTSIASCVILTRTARGNEAGALCNSVLGNLLGLVVTPALLVLLLGTHGDAPILNVVRQLSLEILLPLVVGQMVRLLNARRAAGFERLRPVPSVCLLFLIFCAFCSTFASTMPAGAGRDIAIAIAGAGLLHVLLLGLAWWLTAWRPLGFDRADRIAALLCGTQKTIALGVPMLSILYGDPTRLSWLALPVLCYHPLQLVIDGVLVTRLRAHH